MTKAAKSGFAGSWRSVQTRRPFGSVYVCTTTSSSFWTSSPRTTKHHSFVVCSPHFVSHFAPPLCGNLPLKMRWSLSLFLFGFLAVVHALSSSGNRLLVVLEDGSEKDLYSTFWSDLEGMNFSLDIGKMQIGAVLMIYAIARGYDLVFESPKSDKLSLFDLGERAYDHLLLLPPRSKG